MRKLTGVLMLCCASMALAQGITHEGTHGAGVAENAEGKAARFAFAATKVLSHDRTVISGSLELRIIEREERHGVGVVVPVVRRIVVAEHRAEFAGPGFLNVIDNHAVHHIPGTVVANVADLGVPSNEHDDTDTIRVRFTPQNPEGHSFDFQGHVTHGDIVVSPRQ